MTVTTTPSRPVPGSLATTPFTRALERRVLDFVRRNDILSRGETVVVAVSGGPDSTALLVALARLRSALNIVLTAGHFNHMLRGAHEAAADLDFVRSLASTLDIPLAHAEGDVRARARAKHESLEDAARQLRYAFLAGQAQDVVASAVVTGHTIDDQAETVLLHLIRGAGLDGIVGIRPRSPWPFRAVGVSGGDLGPNLARPLLSLRREETERYCRALGLTPRSDPTNDLPVATRNRLRRELIPTLRSLNPSIDHAIARFAAAAARDADYLDQLARQHFVRITSFGPQTVSFARADLLAAAPAISTRLVRLAFAHVTGATADLEAAHVEALLDSLRKPPGKLSLPGGVTAITDSRAVVLRHGQSEPVRRIPETRLAVPGLTEVSGRVFEAKIVPVPPEVRSSPPNEVFLDAEKVRADLTVRSRRPGDRLRPLGLGGEKKLQDILVDAKVPAAERDGVSLVCGPRGIIWVAGHCIDEHYALRASSRQALHLIAGLTDRRVTDN